MSAYFDNAATTFPKPLEVYDFMNSFYRTVGGNAGRGQYKQSAASTKLIFETRSLLKELLSCPNKEIIFTPSATIAMNMIIQGILQNGKIKNVWISPFEHNAATRILHADEKQNLIKTFILPIENNFSYDEEKIKNAFQKNPPELLILNHASNVCGLVTPVEKICAIAKSFSATTVIDMAQSAGIVPLNVANENFDFAVFAGHKTLMGPFGSAGFVKSKSAKLEPFLFGGTGTQSANQEMPLDEPERFEPGSENILSIAGLNAALKFFISNMEKIRKKENENHARLFELLSSFDFVHIAGHKDRKNCVGIISATFDGYTPDEISNFFDEKDIAVRSGLQCAPLAHKTLGTFPAGTIRFSAGYFTREDDFVQLEKAIKEIGENI